MAEEALDQTVEAAPDEVWALVGDFAGVGDVLPGIDSVELEGDDRIISMAGMRIRERLVARDEATRSLTYSIIDGVPVEQHRATIAVAPEGSVSRVTWTVATTPDEMLPLFADVYRQGLQHLAARFA